MDFKTTVQRELDKFYSSLDKPGFNIRSVTKGAFSKARAQVDPYAFIRLNEIAVNTFYQSASHYLWEDHRLLACDGSRLQLPSHKTIVEEFGVHEFGPKADSPKSLALCSTLYDPLNLTTLDAQIAPYGSSEGALLLKHLDKLKANDLLLLDRGYPSIAIFYLLKARGVEFCVRMKENWWLEIDSFSKSDEIEREVEFNLPKKDNKKLVGYDDFRIYPLKCRLVKVFLENGEIEILCTSLLNKNKYPYQSFKELYKLRWNIEENYKMLKSRAELENFSGKTALAVKQDFHAKIFTMTLCAAYAHPIEEKVREEFKADENRKHDQKINRTSALSCLTGLLTPIFIKKQFKKAIKAFDDLVYKTREIIRPGRKNEHKKKNKKSYNMLYKRL